jgi:hypothetical protein
MTLLLGLALAAKVPVKVNIGIGPTVGTVADPAVDIPISYGVSLSVEAWVSKKTLRSKAVKKRVPKQYRGMVKAMDDLHVRPVYTWVVPDTVLLAPDLSAGFWSPISVYLVHRVKPSHLSVSLAPRLGVVYASETAVGWAGVSLGAELQSPMAKRFGVSAGFDVGPGLAGEIEGVRPWLFAAGRAQVHLRVPLDVKL